MKNKDNSDRMELFRKIIYLLITLFGICMAFSGYIVTFYFFYCVIKFGDSIFPVIFMFFATKFIISALEAFNILPKKNNSQTI